MAAPSRALRLDENNQCIWWSDRRVDLPIKAFQVLCHLAHTPRQVVTKGELLDAVWPEAYVVDAVLSVALSQLREARLCRAGRVDRGRPAGTRSRGASPGCAER